MISFFDEQRTIDLFCKEIDTGHPPGYRRVLKMGDFNTPSDIPFSKGKRRLELFFKPPFRMWLSMYDYRINNGFLSALKSKFINLF
jgi:hypothetical protein